MNQSAPIVGLFSLLVFSYIVHCTGYASTHCVEVSITSSSVKPGSNSGKGSSFTGRILFNQYLSSAKVQEPSDSRTFSGKEAWNPQTPFFLDGQVHTPVAGSHLLTKNRDCFIYNSRSSAVFRSLSLTPFPSMGQFLAREGDTLTTRRLITHKFESAGIVYVDQAHTLADDTLFYLDGAKSSADAALIEGRTVRVFAPQPLMLSAFTVDALIDGMAEKAKPGAKRYHPRGYIEDGTRAFLPTGGEKMANQPLSGTSRRNSVLIDGQFQFSTIRQQLVDQCDQAVLFNISAKKVIAPEFLVARSVVKGIEDGEILSVSPDAIVVRLEKNGSEESVPLADVKNFFLNGLPQDSGTAFKPGQKISIYRALPQRVDVLTAAPYPDFSTGNMSKSFGHLEQSAYDVDGKRHVLKEGALPGRVKK